LRGGIGAKVEEEDCDQGETRISPGTIQHRRDMITPLPHPTKGE